MQLEHILCLNKGVNPLVHELNCVTSIFLGVERLTAVKGHIVVAPDEEVDCTPLFKYLEQLGYVYETAQSGEHLLERVQTQTFDLVLMGINLADMNGYLLLERLKTEPRFLHIPVIVIATQNDIQRIAECIELGAEDYLPVPFNLVLLRARINACLEKKRLYDQEQAYIRKTEKLADDLRFVILPLGIALSAEKNFARLLERIVWESKSICNADAGTMYLVTPDNQLEFAIMFTDSLNIALGGSTGKKIPFAPLNIYDKKSGLPNYNHISTRVALDGKSVNIPDIYQSHELDFSATKEFDRKNGYRTVSNLTVPLKNYDNEVIGVLQLINAQDPVTKKIIPFEAYQQLVVESLASQAAVALSNYILLQRQKELLRFEHDMQVGRKIQEGFLPADLPKIEGWELDAHFQPARQVSGDFYDVFALAEDKLGLVIADVADKGVPAALFMALVRSLIRAFAQEHYSHQWMSVIPLGEQKNMTAVESGDTLKEAILLTNNYITYNHSQLNMFATLFFGVLDPLTGVLSYINCGHNPPIVLNRREVKARLRATGPVIGVMPNMPLELAQYAFEPDDMLLLFTDGVTDVRTINGKFFGEERLLKLLTKTETHSTSRVLAKIKRQINLFRGDAEQFDDITMLALRRLP
jgi:sigma-B regulation protein RsbU (phosphoserine phosphatase)